MPQLDVIAYEGEVRWLILVFLVMYLLLLANGLPNLYKVLLFRLARATGGHQKVRARQIENKVGADVIGSVVKGGLRRMKLGCKEQQNVCQNWLGQEVSLTSTFWDEEGHKITSINFERSLEELCSGTLEKE